MCAVAAENFSSSLADPVIGIDCIPQGIKRKTYKLKEVAQSLGEISIDLVPISRPNPSRKQWYSLK